MHRGHASISRVEGASSYLEKFKVSAKDVRNAQVRTSRIVSAIQVDRSSGWR